MTTQLSVLKNPRLITIGIAESVSGIGDWVTMMAVFTMLVFRGKGGSVQSSGIFLAGMLPIIIASPLAGWLCDHFDRKKLMISSQVLSGLFISGLIFTNRLEFIYTLLALQAVSISVMMPARQAVLPAIVKQEELSQANAFLQQLASIIKIAAPIFAGFVLSVLEPHTAIILDVISFFLSVFILSRLPAMPPLPATDSPAIKYESIPFQQSFSTLISTLQKIPQLAILFISTFLGSFVIIGFDVLGPIFFRDGLHEDERFFGIAIGLVGIGTLLSSLFLMLKKNNPWQAFISGALLMMVISLSMSIATQMSDAALARAVILCGCLIGGLGLGLIHVQTSTLLQTLTPSALLGQMGGMFQSTTLSAQILGMLLVPIIVPVPFSIGTFFSISTLLLITQIVLTVLQLRKHLFKQGTEIPLRLEQV